jgi:hypothetical protein
VDGRNSGDGLVIPGRAQREPGIHEHRSAGFWHSPCSWIPDSRYAASGMTTPVHMLTRMGTGLGTGLPDEDKWITCSSACPNLSKFPHAVPLAESKLSRQVITQDLVEGRGELVIASERLRQSDPPY